MRRLLAMLGVLVLMLATAGASHAVLLSDLLNGGSITAGDKLFDNWTFKYHDASDGRTFNAADVDVTTLTDGGLDPGPGLLYTFSNDALRVFGDGLYAYVDLAFGFRVSVLDPALMIKDATLELAAGSLSGLSQVVDEGMYVHETIGTSTVEAEFSSLSGSVTGGAIPYSVAFAAQKDIWVETNILVWATDIYDAAWLIQFEQRFSQVPVGVPEPGMLSLLALGGIALLRFKRG